MYLPAPTCAVGTSTPPLAMKEWEKSYRWDTQLLQSGVEHFRLAAASVVNVHPTFHIEVAQFLKKAGLLETAAVSMRYVIQNFSSTH